MIDRATALKKKSSQYDPHDAGWLIHESVPNFSPKAAIKTVGIKPPFINDRLAYWPHKQQYVISTFNTCSRVPTPRSLINTGGGYHIEISE
jgi:hypothetical protein